MMLPIITDNLYLRQLGIEDITQTYVDALRDPEIIGLTEARHYEWNYESVVEYVAKSNAQGESQLLGIFIRQLDKHIGNIRLFNFSTYHHRCELGIMIFDKSEWSKGYGAESLKAAVGYGFRGLKLHRIHADYYIENKASARLFEKGGFKVEGIYRHHFFLNGKYTDSVRVARIDE